MKRIVFVWAMGSGLLLAACGGKVFIDLPTGAGADGGSGGAGGSGGFGNSGAISPVGGSGSGVNVGGGPCSTCAGAISDPNANSLCPGESQKLYDALSICICAGPCSNPCAQGCMGGPGDPFPPPCLMCIQDSSPMGCGMALQACSNDF